MEIEWTQHALDSLERIFSYLKSYSSDKTVNYIEKLLFFADGLGSMPFIHPECHELRSTQKIYRSAVFDKKYRIIYKIVGDRGKIFILDVFHTSQNPERISRLKDVE